MRGKLKYFLPALCVFLISVSSLGMAKTAKNEKEIAAIVNDAVITRSELEREMTSVVELLRLNRAEVVLNESQLVQLKNKVLERLIERELLFQQSQQMGLQVREAEIQAELDALKNQFTDPARYADTLASLNISEVELKVEIEREVAIQKLIDQTIVRQTKVSNQEARAFYENHPEYFNQPEQVRIRQIFIKKGGQALSRTSSNGRRQMERILLQLQEGEPFATLAARYSEGRSQRQGGDLGYVKRGEMAESVENWAFALKPGDVSGIIETGDGYYLIQVMDSRPAVRIEFADARPALKKYLMKEKVEERLNGLISTLKQKAAIQRLL